MIQKNIEPLLILLWYSALTNIFLDNTAALRKPCIPAFHNSFFFLILLYVLSYGYFLFCIYYSNTGLPPSLC